jgi:hypothetical protein
MCDVPEHVKWLTDTKERITTADGKTVEVWEFCHQPDEKVLSAWAKYYRHHYCSDEDLEDNCRPKSHTDYLRDDIFPDEKEGFGPSTRAGDFGEILVSDFFEYLLGYWIPRVRYKDRLKRNMSTQGSDMMGFLFAEKTESPNDTLIVTEVKAQLTGKTFDPKLQEAVDHSIKDQIRKGESFNWIKRRTLKEAYPEEKDTFRLRFERFQSPVDRPYKELSGAVAVISNNIYDPAIVTTTTTVNHPNKDNLILITIKGESLMNLVSELYRRAADEA